MNLNIMSQRIKLILAQMIVMIKRTLDQKKLTMMTTMVRSQLDPNMTQNKRGIPSMSMRNMSK